jgi:hypothetical protein
MGDKEKMRNQAMAEEQSRFSPRMAFLCGMLAFGLAGCEAARGVAELTDLATTPAEPKPFVAETRPRDPKYIPVGTTISRDAKRKTVEDFKKLEADLEARRSRNEAAGAQAQQLGKTEPPKPAQLPTN